MYTFQNIPAEALANKEWLVTNGLGGYASSSVLGVNTRRYHGLLVASFNPPTDRYVLVSQIEEALWVDNKLYELSTPQYNSSIRPKKEQYLVSFERLPIPRWVYKIKKNSLAKMLFMVQGANTTVISYQNMGATALHLRLNPLFVYRDYHSLYHEAASEIFDFEHSDNFLKLSAHVGAKPLFWMFSKGIFTENRQWYKDLVYSHEQKSGYNFQEDVYALGYLDVTLAAGETCFLTFSDESNHFLAVAENLREQEIEQIKTLQKTQTDPFLQDLVVAADQFVVQRKSTGSATIIAGYHWFTDWGRDTMIALRGLCIVLGYQSTTKDILTTFLSYVDEGMLPNRFPDNSQDPIEYNTIDATLWLFVVLYEYHQKFDDLTFIEQHFDKLLTILDAHIKGTRFGIHVTQDGLLSGGQGIAQLTWMDARVGDYVVTPRHGCPVEINALWYNALKITLLFGTLLDKDTPQYESLLNQFERHFKEKFWNKKGYLNDVIGHDQKPDTKIRPNQIYALSLPFPLLHPKEQAQVLSTVQQHLYTPLGLRTLSPEEPDFAATYEGDLWQRDSAYHQGTVWVFLLSEYWQAYGRVHPFSVAAHAEMMNAIATLKAHFYEEDCLYGISEIFDGLAPKQGRGTAHQAWSVAAVIQLLTQYGFMVNPKKTKPYLG